jgi:hypothetical protein
VAAGLNRFDSLRSEEKEGRGHCAAPFLIYAVVEVL